MELALVGLQNSGKSAVFDLLAGPACSVPQTGTDRRVTVKLPDPRLEALSKTLTPKRTTPATLSLMDPAPRGASDPFAGARTADGLIVVLRAFDSPEVPHPFETVDCFRDMNAVFSEILLSDMVVLDARLEKIERLAKVGVKPENPLEIKLLERCKASLEAEQPLGDLQLSPSECRLLSGFGLVSTKPWMAVINVGESDPEVAGAPLDRAGLLAELSAAFPDKTAMSVCAPFELELAAMEADEAAEFMEAEGLERLGGPAILEALTGVCGRVTFYTVIKEEVRAWTVPESSTAAQAAGEVHTDMEKGFIKAEVIGWQDMVQCGSNAAAREKGLLRLEGREYEVRDGDVLTIRFSPK